MNNNNYVTASEIGDYIFCKRGWWMRSHGFLPTTDEMLQGTDTHNRLASLLWWHKILLILGLILVGIGGIGIVIYILISII